MKYAQIAFAVLLPGLVLISGKVWGQQKDVASSQQSDQVRQISKVDLQRRIHSKWHQGGFHGIGRNVAVSYIDRLEFFALPPEISLGSKGLANGKQAISPMEVTPVKII